MQHINMQINTRNNSALVCIFRDSFLRNRESVYICAVLIFFRTAILIQYSTDETLYVMGERSPYYAYYWKL